MGGVSKKGYERGWPEQGDGWGSSRMEEAVSKNSGSQCAGMSSCAPGQKRVVVVGFMQHLRSI